MILSKRQHVMLRMFADMGPQAYLTVNEMQRFDQRPFRSLLIRQYVTYRAGRGFHISRQGMKAWAEFLNTPVIRKNPFGPLTAIFDLASHRVQETPARQQAAA